MFLTITTPNNYDNNHSITTKVLTKFYVVGHQRRFTTTINSNNIMSSNIEQYINFIDFDNYYRKNDSGNIRFSIGSTFIYHWK